MMSTRNLLFVGVGAIALVGCADLSEEVQAMESLLVSAVSGSEDMMSAESGSRMDDRGGMDVSEGG